MINTKLTLQTNIIKDKSYIVNQFNSMNRTILYSFIQNVTGDSSSTDPFHISGSDPKKGPIKKETSPLILAHRAGDYDREIV